MNATSIVGIVIVWGFSTLGVIHSGETGIYITTVISTIAIVIGDCVITDSKVRGSRK